MGPEGSGREEWWAGYNDLERADEGLQNYSYEINSKPESTVSQITAKLATPASPLPTPTSLPNPGNLTLSVANEQPPGNFDGRT